ncbi:MAG: CotH kinase family protein [Candidatus Zhuqueibacterota bacterium]
MFSHSKNECRLSHASLSFLRHAGRSTVLTAAVLLALMVNSAPADEKVVFTDSNLPIVVIDTHGLEIQDEPKITADMGIIYNGEGVRNYLYDDPYNEYFGKIGIEYRGSSTQSFPKKQFAVETRDIHGNDSTVSLLGFPPEDDWILYAPFTDKSLMRNVLAYKLFNDMGRYASRSRYCEVVLNGDYVGVYVLMEKIKRDKNRVNISKLEPQDSQGDDLTGGYIFKIDKSDGAKSDGWESPFLPIPGSWQRIFYQYHYPDQEEITPVQKSYIQNFMYRFESMMQESDYADQETGYRSQINVDTFVDNFIILEMAKNVDGYRLSTYFHKDRDSKNGKLSLGPIWDYNLAFGNADYYDGAVISGWQVEFYQIDDYWQNPFWWRKLMADTSFVNAINARWYQLRGSVLDVFRIEAIIDSLVTHIDEAQKRNFQRWPILSEYIWPNAYIGGSYSAEVRYLKQWVHSRILWMDAHMVGASGVERSDDSGATPGNFTLNQNYPNPFNASTRIDYQLLAPAHVRLVLYDLLGRSVAVLADAVQPAGNYATVWDGADANGQPVADGVYILRLESGEHYASIKLALVK